MNKKEKVLWERLVLNSDLQYLLSTVKEEDHLLLTGDEDSILCAAILKKIIKKECNIDIKVGAFFDMGGEYSIISYVDEPIPDENLICCDCSLLRGFLSDKSHIRTIDNHVNKLTKDDNYSDKVFTLNMNANITHKNYTDKAATSSAYTLLVAYNNHNILYDNDKTSYTAKQKRILMSIDGFFHAHYKGFRAYQLVWQYVCEIDKHFSDVLSVSYNDFKKIQKNLNLNGGYIKMYVNNLGILDIDDNCLNFLDEFKSVDPDFVQEIKQLNFKSFVPYKYFEHKIKQEDTLDTLKKEYGDIVNLAVTDTTTIKGCSVCEHSTVRYYNN